MADEQPILLNNRRVLIVDDTHSIHQDFQKILLVDRIHDLSDMEAMLFGQGLSEPKRQSIDFQLDSAFQGSEALDMVKTAVAENRPYALAFVDVRMPPGWDGIQTIEYLWQVDSDLQVVICTAYSDYSWQETFDRLGNSDKLLVLKKPFESIEVLQLANALVQKWNSTTKAQMKMEQLEQLVTKRTAKIAAQNQQLENKIQELEQTRAQLIQSEKLASIGQLAAGIAHEINNPTGFVHSNLDVLAGYVENLCSFIKASSERAANLDELKQRFDIDYILEDMPILIQEALGGTARVKEIVADLKDYSYMKQDAMKLEDINQLIEQAINISKNETKYQAEIVKEYTAVPAIPCWRSKLIQVILNLLLNAGQAVEGEKDGKITITTSQTDSHVIIIIADNGSGIAVADIDKVFDPFFTTKEIGTGTGLGLHISHSIVESHGGTISVESEVGHGSQFTIALPLSNPLFE